MSTGIDFVIGGKDRAGPAMAKVGTAMAKLESGANRLKTATMSLTAAMAPLLAIFALVRTVQGFGNAIADANAAYDKQADAVSGLNKALELQGANVAKESARLQAFAGDMQKLTGVGDEATLEFMRQASMLGVNADQLEDVTKATIGLSEVTGKGLNESLKALQQAQEGNFSAFEESFPQMKNLATAEEKLAFATQMAAKGLEAKADASMTVSGMAERANGAIGDLMEMVGQLLAPIRILISQGLKTLAESLQQVLAPAAQYAQSVLENIGPVMDYVKEKVVQAINAVVAAFTFVEVVVTNLGSVWELMVATAELGFEKLKNIVMHVLTEVIPGYATWFGENFVNLIRDAMNLAVTIVTNDVQKLIDTFMALWDFIKSGGTTNILGSLGEIAGRSYLEGFESSLTALPDIAERQLSTREQQLSERIGAIGADLGAQFSAKFAQRMIKLDDELGADFNKEIDLKINKKIGEELGVAGKAAGTQTLSASESRLLTRGPSDRRTDLMEDITRKLSQLLNVNESQQSEIAASRNALQEIADNTSDTTQLVPT